MGRVIREPKPIDPRRQNYCDCGTLAAYQIGNARICVGCYQKDHSLDRRDKSKKTGDGRGLPTYTVSLPKVSRNDA
jgi:hypothetical protein